MVQNNNTITSLVLLEDGRLATAEERRIKIWNPNSGDQEGEIVGNRTQITALASIKEDVLASGTRAGIVKIWHISEGDAVKTITAHTSGVTSLAALDEHRLASAAEDGWIKVWDIESGRELIRFAENFGHVISLVRIPDGSLCSVCLNDKFIRIWNTDSGHLVKTIDAGEIVYSVAAFKDNALVAGLDKGKIKVWKKHRESSEKLYTAEADQIIWLYVEGPIRSILVLSNGFVATGSAKGKIRVYNLAKPERSIRVFLGHINSVTYLLPLKDQSLFISSGSEDGKINIWNVNTDKIVRTFGTNDLAAEVPHSFTEFIYKEQKRIETTLNTNVKTFEVELPKLEARAAEPSSKAVVVPESKPVESVTVVEETATTTIEVTLNVIEEADETASTAATDSEPAAAVTESEVAAAPAVTESVVAAEPVTESEPAAAVEPENVPEQTSQE